MPASIVARVVRMPVLAAVAATALAACSNDPMSPAAPRSNIRNSVSAAPANAGADATPSSGVTTPWFRGGSDATPSSGVTTPWF